MRIESYADIIRSTTPEEMSQADPQVREHIFKLFHREQHIVSNYSQAEAKGSEETKKVYLKHHYTRKLLRPDAQVPRALFMERLSEREKEVINYLLFTVLSTKLPDSTRFWSLVDVLLAVGSSTWPEKDWETLQTFVGEEDDEVVQYKLANRGADIDLLLGADKGLETDTLLNYLKILLDEYDIDYEYDESTRVDGKTYMKAPKSHPEDGKMYKFEHKSYGTPNFVVKMPGSRPIHLGLHTGQGEQIRQKEWYDGRSFAVLFDRFDLKIEFQELLRGEREEQVSLTVEEKLKQLKERKKHMRKEKIDSHKRRRFQQRKNNESKEINF